MLVSPSSGYFPRMLPRGFSSSELDGLGFTTLFGASSSDELEDHELEDHAAGCFTGPFLTRDFFAESSSELESIQLLDEDVKGNPFLASFFAGVFT